MEPSVSISTSGPDPGELMVGTPRSLDLRVFPLPSRAPTISSSHSLFSKRSAALTLIP